MKTTSIFVLLLGLPGVAAGAIDRDGTGVEAIGAVRTARTDADFTAVLQSLIDVAGTVPPCTGCAAPREAHPNNRDDRWLHQVPIHERAVDRRQVFEQTPSHAEFTVMALQPAPAHRVIGSPTAGADGNVAAVELPGGIRTSTRIRADWPMNPVAKGSRHLFLRPQELSMRFPTAALVIAAVLVAEPIAAQTPPAQPAHPLIVSASPARAEDVASIDAIIGALYDVISGPAGQARDWNRMRSLFVPGALLIPTSSRPGGMFGARVMSVNDYIAEAGAYLVETGFTEREIARRTDVYSRIAHVFTTYEGVMETTGARIRGINSIQLLNDGARWWILSVFWEQEGPNTPLPAEYLPR